MLQIAMFIGGIYVMFKGEVRATQGKLVKGWRARAIGFVLFSTLPLAFVLGFILGVLGAAGVIDMQGMPIFLLDLGVVVLCGIVAAVLAFAWSRPESEWDELAVEQPYLPPVDSQNPYHPPRN